VLIDLRKEYKALQSGVSRVDALLKSVASAELLIKATEQSIKGGVRINLDLLNAKEQLYTSKRDGAARYNYLLSSLRLRAAAGTLSPDDVRAMAPYFR
jgi:protease secretion system outer membrane protein